MKETHFFYRDLVPLESFSKALQTKHHSPIPLNWWVVVADVVGSTEAIEAGNYKKVNTVSVACIAAAVNVNRDIEIPFVFGGDGATFCVPDLLVQEVTSALRGAQKLSRKSFDLELRVGLVKVEDLIKQNFWVNVGKVRLSEHMTYSTFSGRGWEEAERRLKTPGAVGVILVHDEDKPAKARFDGFECRWQSVPSFNGHKLSLLIAAIAEDANINLKTYQNVYERIHAIYGHEENYHPLRATQLKLTLNPRLLSHEWRVKSNQMHLMGKLKYFIKLLFLGIAGKYLFARNLDTVAVKWSLYRDELVENTDFRKFDGVFKLIIDGNNSQADELESYLQSMFEKKLLVYGMHKSKDALITCLVQSYNGNHLHFVDGSDGGYTMAAKGLKQQLKLIKR